MVSLWLDSSILFFLLDYALFRVVHILKILERSMGKFWLSEFFLNLFPIIGIHQVTHNLLTGKRFYTFFLKMSTIMTKTDFEFTKSRNFLIIIDTSRQDKNPNISTSLSYSILLFRLESQH